MDIIKAVKQSQNQHAVEWAKETNCIDDNKFVQSNGATTYAIAESLNVSVYRARQLLNKAHKSGAICKSKNNAGRYCLWWPNGYLKEINATNTQE